MNLLEQRIRLLFAKQKAKVVIATIEDEGAETANEINRTGGDAVYIQTDVSSDESIRRLVNQTIQQ